MEIVRRLTAGHCDRLRPVPQLGIGLQCASGERLLEPGRAVPFEGRQTGGGGIDILAEDLAGIDQEDAIRAEPLARRVEMIFIRP